MSKEGGRIEYELDYDRGMMEGEVVWLCPVCAMPSANGATNPDEGNRLCDHGHPLSTFTHTPEVGNLLADKQPEVGSR